MHYFTLEASTSREALEKMRRMYGDGAKVHTHREIRTGGVLGMFRRTGVEITGYLPSATRTPGAATEAPADLQQAKERVIQSARSERGYQRVLDELESIKQVLGRPPSTAAGEHLSLGRLRSLMEENEFTPAYTAGVVERVRDTLSVADLDDFDRLQGTVVEWIGDGLSIHGRNADSGDTTRTARPRVVVIVGPTGVGKTTTIAKLAAGFGLAGGYEGRVRMVTIDNYRIGARQQIDTYGEIMRIPVSGAESGDDLRKAVGQSEPGDIVLVDTIGKSPSDAARLGEMKEMLDALGSSSEVHLAISATTKAADIAEILRQFEPFRYRSIIVTKLDETSRIGSLVSVLTEQGKPISYVCAGQVVPQDIEEASVVRLLIHLDGFRLDRIALEKRFGAVPDSMDLWG